MKINKVAILGSGVMGSQIAGVFANANIPTILFGQEKNIEEDLKKISKFKPKALTHPSKLLWMSAASYENNLTELLDCDLIIEAIVENMQAKKELFEKIKPYISENTILASNTSSLSIDELAFNLGKGQSNFCGLHFFNPPRYMSLVEIIPTKQTNKKILDDLEEFITSELGKNIIYAKDSPGFIANRIGVFSIASCIYHAERLNINFDTVDALTGTKLDRPKSATFRTADLVGLDILKHVYEQFDKNLNDDPWHHYFKTPNWLNLLIEQHKLGEKTKCGVYKKEDGKIKVYNVDKQEYVEANYKINPSVKKILKKDRSKWIELLKDNNNAESQFLYSVIKDVCLYSAYHLDEVGESCRDIDWAMRWGFGWENGVFELWQDSGVEKTLNLFMEKTKNDRIIGWVRKTKEFYNENGAYSPSEESYKDNSNHKVYDKQLYRPTLLGEKKEEYQNIIFENDSARFFEEEDGVTVFSFKTKLNTLNLESIYSLRKAIRIAEEDFKAMIIWQEKTPFSAGANLYEIVAGAKLGMIDHQNLYTKIKQKVWHLLQPNLPSVDNLIPINEVIELLQETLMELKHSNIPTIAAIDGLAIGGGCEMLLHCNRRVATTESYIGLVEMGVGLLPAGGGSKEMAIRASVHPNRFEKLAQYFEQIAMAKVSSSALDAIEMDYLGDKDIIVAQKLELLYFAKQQARQMIDQHYRPEGIDAMFKVVGTTGKANILAQLTNMKAGKYISEHDYLIAEKMADVLCGSTNGDNVKVGNQYLLNLEKEHFIELLKEEKTQDRIEHMLIKHKPLRN